LYSVENIASIIDANLIGNANAQVAHLLIDSRKVVFTENTLFIALKSKSNNGHNYIKPLIEKGVKIFLIDKTFTPIKNDALCFLQVENTLIALQQLAAHHRQQFKYPVIAITGSNGKTIVKEWLYHILKDTYNIVRSPRSYNSQIGVPLSVWQMNSQHNLAIIEAGISKPNEMLPLENIIKPTLGVLTNIGTAHDAGFISEQEKLQEKLLLFKNVETLIAPKKEANSFEKSLNQKVIAWSEAAADLTINKIEKVKGKTKIIADFNATQIEFSIPFSDDASIENAITCYLVANQLGLKNETIFNQMSTLPALAMRMEMKAGINNCTIINDSYSNDLESLNMAFDFLHQQSTHDKKTLILSDFEQINLSDEDLIKVIVQLLQSKKIHRFVGIGNLYENFKSEDLGDETHFHFYNTTPEFLADSNNIAFDAEAILVKGARSFGFENIVNRLSYKSHQTVLEVNLNALQNNLNQYKNLLNSNTKIMVMVKAFAYGSGMVEVAKLLEHNQVDYLTVAYADEGLELRQAGIQLPIMVMNSDASQWAEMFENNLEPEIFSSSQLKQWLQFKDHNNCPVHFKIDTGMKRLGFNWNQLDELLECLQNNPSIKIASIFSHLAASENANEKDFTLQQIERFNIAIEKIKSVYSRAFISHILNSSGINNYTDAHLDMVRLGIGLYGIDTSKQINLENVMTLKSYISQIKRVQQGESIGYGRSDKATGELRVAIIGIGYGDGLDRRLSNGVGQVKIGNQFAPIIGKVCMDMTIVDITNIESAYEGQAVTIFGEDISFTDVAALIGTIPYELMTGISERVKRVFYQE